MEGGVAVLRVRKVNLTGAEGGSGGTGKIWRAKEEVEGGRNRRWKWLRRIVEEKRKG